MQQWVSIIKKLYLLNRGEVTDVIPRVLKYIALFEEGETKGEINLSDCYRILSDISYGLASKEIDNTQSYFFYKCLHKLSLRLKKEDLSEHRAFLNSIDDFAQLNQMQPGEKKDVLNPLNVPSDLLLPTSGDMTENFLEPDIILNKTLT